jgi:lysozyme
MGRPGFVRCSIWLALIGCVEPIEPDGSTVEQAGTVCADGPTVQGMDVSYYETSVDWAAAHQAGVEFAFVRVSDGLQFMDPKFPAYWSGAKAAGVIRGAYQFFRPAEDPIAQADLLLGQMGPLGVGDLPPVLDVEVSGGLTTAGVAASVRAWVAHVTAAIGRPPIVYAGLYSWHDLTGSANVTTSPLWVAQYTTAPCPNIPTPWTRWLFWQYSATGSVAGIPGATLDVNVFNGTLDALHDFTSGGTCGDGRCNSGETADSCAVDCPPCGTIAAAGGTIDDGDACFVAGGPTQYLRRVAGSGEQGDLMWTHATPSASEANFAQWNLFLAEAGRYRIEAYTAHGYASSTRAAYVVQGAGPPATRVIDQAAADGWQVVGDVDFAAGGAQWIHLADNTGEPAAASAQLVFDAIRLTRVRDDEPPPAGDPGAAAAGCTAAPGAGPWLIVLWLGALGRRRRRSLAGSRSMSPSVPLIASQSALWPARQ